MKRTKIGQVAPNKVPIYDHKMRIRGAVGPLAGPVTVSRFTGSKGATLQKVKGRMSWVAPAPKMKTKPRVSSLSLEKSLRTAKGSNSG